MLARELELEVVCGLVEGEVLDVQLGRQPVAEVALDQVLRMIRLKTAVLYEFAARAGAMLGLNTTDAGNLQVKALATFCLDCGIAFQLQDDILGVVGDAAKLGKPVGSDVREGKRTPIVLAAYEVASDAQRARLEAVLGDVNASDGAVAEVTGLLVELGAVARVSEMARGLVQQAFSALDELPETCYREWLRAWADYMIAREL
jgi:geranylgeranyl diphosphate synthase type I